MSMMRPKAVSKVASAKNPSQSRRESFASTPVNSSGQGGKTDVRVVCRVRPVTKRDLDYSDRMRTKEGLAECVSLIGTDGSLEYKDLDKDTSIYTFDKVFGADSSQESVFQDTASPLIDDVLRGYNATILAYGQTGTGKTFTMEGDLNDEAMKGVIPRSLQRVFSCIQESQSSSDVVFEVKVSFIEIYMERIKDLLDPSNAQDISIREDKLKGLYVQGVTEKVVSTASEVMQIMRIGSTSRATSATLMNEESSRSHSVFTVSITQSSSVNKLFSKLVLVDLAGSEMVKKTNASGQQLEEAKTINKSLSALGLVINALTDSSYTHIPYRDSKLTRILQDSLGGNAKTALIINISPVSFDCTETLSTLRFGSRAKFIQNKAHVNQMRGVEELERLLADANKIITDLQGSQSGLSDDSVAKMKRLQDEVELLAQIIEGKDAEISRLLDMENNRPPSVCSTMSHDSFDELRLQAALQFQPLEEVYNKLCVDPSARARLDGKWTAVLQDMAAVMQRESIDRADSSINTATSVVAGASGEELETLRAQVAEAKERADSSAAAKEEGRASLDRQSEELHKLREELTAARERLAAEVLSSPAIDTRGSIIATESTQLMARLGQLELARVESDRQAEKDKKQITRLEHENHRLNEVVAIALEQKEAATRELVHATSKDVDVEHEFRALNPLSATRYEDFSRQHDAHGKAMLKSQSSASAHDTSGFTRRATVGVESPLKPHNSADERADRIAHALKKTTRSSSGSAIAGESAKRRSFTARRLLTSDDAPANPDVLMATMRNPMKNGAVKTTGRGQHLSPHSSSSHDMWGVAVDDYSDSEGSESGRRDVDEVVGRASHVSSKLFLDTDADCYADGDNDDDDDDDDDDDVDYSTAPPIPQSTTVPDSFASIANVMTFGLFSK